MSKVFLHRITLTAFIPCYTRSHHFEEAIVIFKVTSHNSLTILLMWLRYKVCDKITKCWQQTRERCKSNILSLGHHYNSRKQSKSRKQEVNIASRKSYEKSHMVFILQVGSIMKSHIWS